MPRMMRFRGTHRRQLAKRYCFDRHRGASWSGRAAADAADLSLQRGQLFEHVALTRVDLGQYAKHLVVPFIFLRRLALDEGEGAAGLEIEGAVRAGEDGATPYDWLARQRFTRLTEARDDRYVVSFVVSGNGGYYWGDDDRESKYHSDLVGSCSIGQASVTAANDTDGADGADGNAAFFVR